MDKDHPNYPKLLLGRPPLTVNELLCNKTRWCQEADGQDAAGHHLSARDPEATSWCLGGALQVVYGHNPLLLEQMQAIVLTYLRERKEPTQENEDISISGWNDDADTTFKMVRKVIIETKV